MQIQPLVQNALSEVDDVNIKNETGFMFTLKGIPNDENPPVLETYIETVTGYIVDRFCSYDNNFLTLDTNVSLKAFPNKHTVFCMRDVDVCKNSGYAFVYKPDGSEEYDILYLLDDAGNQLVQSALAEVDDLYIKNETGFMFTITGVPNYNLDPPVLYTVIDSIDTTTTAEPEPTDSSSNKNG